MDFQGGPIILDVVMEVAILDIPMEVRLDIPMEVHLDFPMVVHLDIPMEVHLDVEGQDVEVDVVEAAVEEAA